MESKKLILRKSLIILYGACAVALALFVFLQANRQDLDQPAQEPPLEISLDDTVADDVFAVSDELMSKPLVAAPDDDSINDEPDSQLSTENTVDEFDVEELVRKITIDETGNPLIEEEPSEEPSASAANEALVSDAPEEPASADGVMDEVASMRTDMKRMQDMLDLVLNEFVLGLKNENNELREEIARLRDEIETKRTLPFPPQPSQSLLQAPTAANPSVDTPLPSAPEPVAVEYTEKPDTEGAVHYAIIKEWGRDHEQAARLENASTLKGMICVVPPASTDDQLAKLGRWIRQNYDDFDNINVDIFDDVPTAEKYAETNKVEGGTRVMNISKHPATDRDNIVLFKNGAPIVIPDDL